MVIQVKCSACGVEYTFDTDKDTHKWEVGSTSAPSTGLWVKCPYCGAETRVETKS